jgi:hypothetical protein
MLKFKILTLILTGTRNDFGPVAFFRCLLLTEPVAVARQQPFPVLPN